MSLGCTSLRKVWVFMVKEGRLEEVSLCLHLCSHHRGSMGHRFRAWQPQPDLMVEFSDP